eukprot:symbB.v1.2.018485.t1/scaffold1464.1/size117165/8
MMQHLNAGQCGSATTSASATQANLKSEASCPAAWPASYIVTDEKKRPEPEEGNPWHRLNQKLEEKLTQDSQTH